jgi:hypothetical protein
MNEKVTKELEYRSIKIMQPGQYGEKKIPSPFLLKKRRRKEDPWEAVGYYQKVHYLRHCSYRRKGERLHAEKVFEETVDENFQSW